MIIKLTEGKPVFDLDDFKFNPIKHGLIVGINDYEEDRRTGRQIDLAGCVRDAKAVHKVIKNIMKSNDTKVNVFKRVYRFFFGKKKHSNLVLLLDKKATKAKVAVGLINMIQRINPGECGVFYRSGHGSYIRDASEADGTTELFCTHRFLNGEFITDDEFNFTINLNLKKGAQLLVIADTCHSGDSIRSISPNSTISARYVGDHNLKIKTFNYKVGLPAGVINWTACADDEVSYERRFNGHVQGVFTHHLLKHLREVLTNKKSLKEGHTVLSRQLNDGSETSQTPQLEVYR